MVGKPFVTTSVGELVEEKGLTPNGNPIIPFFCGGGCWSAGLREFIRPHMLEIRAKTGGRRPKCIKLS